VLASGGEVPVSDSDCPLSTLACGMYVACVRALTGRQKVRPGLDEAAMAKDSSAGLGGQGIGFPVKCPDHPRRQRRPTSSPEVPGDTTVGIVVAPRPDITPEEAGHASRRASLTGRMVTWSGYFRVPGATRGLAGLSARYSR
jgi:hypothetical protein